MDKKLRLLIPGPTPVPPQVSEAMARPMVGHRSKGFAELTARLTGKLQQIMQTSNPVFILTSSGTGGLEAAVANTVNPGDKVLALVGGKFGERFRDLARVYGAEVIELDFPWGQPVDLATVKKQLDTHPDITLVLATLNETSTAVINDIEGIGALTRKHGAVLVVDAVSGLGGVEMKPDEWGVDILVTASQKALMVPPGLALVSVSDKAWDLIAKCKSPRYYFSLEAARKSYAKWNTAYTPAVSLFFGLEAATDLILEEGLENVFARHRLLARATREAAKALGLRLLMPEECASPLVTAVISPEGVDVGDLRKLLLDKYGVLFAGGQGELSGRIFRIAHMGYADHLDVISSIAALEMALSELGYGLELGKGVAAAQKVFLGGAN
ncbi:MAG: alanine--glyoxylate aminotransferase family protein [Eubacteriales bacterium]|jgi:aspartate aminotransferase-like enzyme|nr:alanine--glyoxylate aminotransferase family protein [Bacillota bacterium]MBV1727970.1 alanine--glyoxylate aminotransferase family protein [Desulforudis sp.]MDQ7789077.1 alanine--glyoxylate aminotransferase family protein [Clostridia bacterium]MDZ4042179.1 alanine--glyoxylate aminotransferase family protein [Eubacteriales bacterium]MBU4532989.1 alanine--glyoxylate aminotransferase family protein [Bacillota bacterium]